MAVEFAQLGVRVNAVAPGEIETAMLSPNTETLIPRIPLRRLGQPAEVASAIFHLCSADSSYVTGAEMFITGGQHLF
jgi:NAD(P)-dependent dehydrogenase (short-subunit alcohol dehydrogenase family)